MTLNPAASSVALVTGATGFIGKPLCANLEASGWAVRAVQRRGPEGPTEQQPPARTAIIVPDLLAILQPHDRATWLARLHGVDTVFHLAARVHMPGGAADDRSYHDLNARVSGRLADLAAEAGVRRFVLLSSVKAVGEASGGSALTPSTHPEPRDAYGRSKLEAERQVAQALTGSATSYCIVRPPLVCGPGARANLAALLAAIERGLPLPVAGIDNRRSIVGLRNLVDLLTDIAPAATADGRVLMPADGDWSTPAMVRTLAAALDRPARLFHCPTRALLLGASLLRRAPQAQRLIESLRIEDPYLARTIGWRPLQASADALSEMARAWARARRAASGGRG